MSSFIMYDRFGNDMQYWFIGGAVIASIALKESGSVSSTKELFLQRLDDNVFIGISLHGGPEFVVGNDRLFLIYRDKRYTGRMSLSSKLALLEERYYEENCHIDRSTFFADVTDQKTTFDKMILLLGIKAIDSLMQQDCSVPMDLFTMAYIAECGYYHNALYIPDNNDVIKTWNKLKERNVYFTRDNGIFMIHYPWRKEEEGE